MLPVPPLALKVIVNVVGITAGILPQSLDLGVSEHDVAVARIVFNAADLPRLEFLTIRRGKAAGGKNIPAGPLQR